MTDQNIVAVNQIVRRVEVTTPGPAGRDGTDGSAGVSKIIAGTANVTLSPAGGTGDVTVSVAGDGTGTVTSVSGGTAMTVTGDATVSPTVNHDNVGPGATVTNLIQSVSTNAQGHVTSMTGAGDTAAFRSNIGLKSTAITDMGTTADKVVQLDGSARLPAVDGSQLTNLPAATSMPASGLTSGSLSIDLIPNADGTLDLGSTDFRWNEIHGSLDGAVHFRAKNTSGGTLSVGDIVFISGATGSELANVELADADDASKMPAFGMISTGGSNNSEVYVTTLGTVTNVDVPSGTYSVGDEVHVSTTAGEFSLTAPTGETGLIQKIGRVMRVNSGGGANGTVKIMGAGRTNAVPNLDSGKIFYGNGSDQAVSTTLTSVAEAAGAVSTHAAVTTGVHGISSFGATLVDDADAAAARTTLGLGTAALLATGISDTNVIQAGSAVSNNDFLRINGTTVRGRSASETLSDIGAQPLDADLTAIAGLTSAADKGIQFTGSGSAAVYDLTAAGKALLDDADAAAQRTTLGLKASATTDIGTTAGDLIVLDGSAKLPAVDGSQLTNLPGGGVTSIVAGTNVTISPVGGTGAVTVNSSGGGAASTDWIQDPGNTGTWRLFDDLLGSQPLMAAPWGSGHQQQPWSYFSDSDDGDIIGGYRIAMTTSLYGRGGITCPNLGKTTPADGDNWLVEMRVKIEFGIDADTTPQFSFGVFQGAVGAQDAFGPGYGSVPRAGIYVTMQGTAWQSYISDSTALAGTTKAALSPSVAFSNGSTYNLACHGTYLTASGGWEMDWYIDGTLVHTSTLTAGVGCPFVRTNLESGNEPPAINYSRYTQFDWISMQYTRPATVTYLDIDDL